MGIIKELSTELSNQIAAGEVVERPASVVKELVENAIDAGATMITVRIERGGISRIQVTDDGCGMSRDDAIECFKRHATSKISTAADLEAIYTMGFRGEALSSIAAVSQVDLYTKRTQDAVGTHVVCADGEIQSCTDEGMPDGTTFTVSNIFYNIPARMKFLKRDATEASYITDLMARFILSHPEISFRYINSRKEIYFSAGDRELVNCVYTIYGKDYAKSAAPIDYKQDYIRVSGLAGKGDTARPNRAYQSFFVNKRYIKSPLISKAVEEAYKNQVMSGKYPMAVLNIDINASMIDINVHPTKQEVKFSNEGDIFTAVLHAVENALHKDFSIPKVEKKIEEKPVFKADIKKADAQYELEWAKNKDRWTPADEVAQNLAEKPKKSEEKVIPDSYKCDVSPEYFEKRRLEILKETPNDDNIKIPLLNEDFGGRVGFEMPESKTPFRDAIMKAEQEKRDREEKTAVSEIISEREQKAETEKVSEYVTEDKAVREPEPTAESELVTAQNPFMEKPFKIVGQVFATYIIVEREDEMLIIDQHAAHERLKFEELKKELAGKAVSAQDLLIPVNVDLTPIEYAVFSENEEFLETLGFEADDFGGNSLVVRTAPTYVDYDDVEQLLVEVIDQISQNKSKPMAEKAEYALYTIACKAAIKANHAMKTEELEALVTKIFEIEPINTCPHGRPIIISMSKKEIEKEFKRIL